jgi:hypothetical protein
MAKLSKDDRDQLPDKSFGLPSKRAYPMPDAAHARDAKARASQAKNRGKLSAAEESQVDRKADKILKKKKK